MKARKLMCLLLTLAMLASLTACGGSSKATAENEMFDAQMPAEAPESGMLTTDSAAGVSLPTDRKLIRTIHIEAETEDMAPLAEELAARIAQLGGYVEAKNQRGGSRYGGYIRRSMTMTIRIPADQADAFLEQVNQHTNVVSSSETVQDVTLQYVDTESHVKALETEQERLLDLLEQAKNLQEILEIEARLTDVRYELERYASQLRTLDNQISYATIHLSLTEVKEYTPVVEEETLWQRIRSGFAQSLKDIGQGFTDLLVWLAVNSPYLLIWIPLGCAALVLLRKLPRRKSGKKSPPPEKTE